MDVILIPGLWLDGSSWEQVVPVLEEAGHRAHPLTLPGMESKDVDRSAVALQDHVAAVVAAIDSLSVRDEPVALVAHSAGCGIAHAAIDARPEGVACAVYIAGFPTADGDALAPDFPVVDGEVPLPRWTEFEEEDLAGLDEPMRANFRRRAIPSPAGVTCDRQQLSDDRRYEVPVTVIATEFTSEMLRGWVAAAMPPVREFASMRSVEYIDLPTGHWPQFTRPKELGRAIVEAVKRSPGG